MLQRWCDAAVLVATVLLVLACVLAMGAGHYWGRALIQLTAAGLGIVWSLRLLAGPVAVLPRASGLAIPAGIAVLVGLLVMPLIPLPPRALKALSPRAFEVVTRALPGWPSRAPFADLRRTLDLQPTRLSLAEQLPPAGAWRPLALVPHDTALTLSIGAAYVLVAGVLAFYHWPGGGRRAVTLVMSSLIAVGLFEALYGLLQASAGYRRIYWFECPRPACMGTYVNKDHYAGLLEMIFPIALARTATWCVALRREAGVLQRSLGAFRPRAFVDALSGTLGRLVSTAAIALLVLSALAASGSRSAFAATVGSLLVMASLLPGARQRQRWIRAMGSVAVGGLTIVWLSFPQIFGRLWEGDLTRPLMAADAFDMVRDFPLLGIGLGNFASVFPLYRARTVEVWEFGVSDAHNDYLEWVAEVGMPAAGLSFALLVGFGWRVLRALRAAEHWTPQALRRWGLGAGVLALLLHSCTDFNLHIPANALVFAVLTGSLIRLTRPAPSETVAADLSLHVVRRRWLIPSVALLLCVLWAAFIWRQWDAAAAYRRVYPDLRLRDLVTPRVEPSGVESLLLTRRAAELVPHASQFQAGVGEQLVARTSDASTSQSEAADLLDAALIAYIRSLWAAPLQPRLLLDMAAAAEPIYEPDPGSEPGVLYDLVERAVALAPYEAGVQLGVAEWLLDHWDTFPGGIRHEVQKHVETALALAARSSELRQRVAATEARYRRLLGEEDGRTANL